MLEKTYYFNNASELNVKDCSQFVNIIIEGLLEKKKLEKKKPEKQNLKWQKLERKSECPETELLFDPALLISQIYGKK